MPAKRTAIISQFQPLAMPHDKQVQRLARASALLTRGALRRLQAEPAQTRVENIEEFIHNAPLIQGGVTSHDTQTQ